ncbi:PepSY-associated TM helix domain-containing protein [Thalassovita mediterranea]|jgi:uncharacterized iron-regulated membrane protein|uniref:Putative iron-regulated membrane protein n=1 Tax=Thalassovita mediterranea TaxID=340021 RepID=A0A0P1GZM2_9RHOB|nr:PepSY domain-containing protein [Thalassovita mediterranea]CUH83040.1 putative iron-regulated membrane protein [Thalassovita mediterranea]SIS31201.1 Uncharacterized iron-regulated membrane protein [Thalassovita mediterranea]
MTDMTLSARPDVASGGVLYRLVWKWHFLASLYVLPFMAMLALTGGVYLYKPQIEAWLYADQMFVTEGEARLSVEDQLASLTANTPDAPGVKRLRGITQYDDPTRSTLVEFNTAANVRSYAWINPYTGELLGHVARDDTPMRMLKKFHGELLLGKTGTKFVELSAHWAIVMFITGIYLWWPRGSRSLRRAVSPPKGSPKRGRSWWRETHLFTGFLATILVVPILVTGLPWTDVWGGSLKYVQEQTGQKSGSLRFSRSVPKSTASEGVTLPYDQVFAIAAAEGLAAPYEMRPPKNDSAAFWIRSAHIDRSEQTELIIDQYSGAVLKRHDFGDNPVVARAVSWGISFHQGEMYGWLNLAQNTLAALLAFALALSGFVAWWKRRPAGGLGVPAAPDASMGWGMIALITVLSVLLPLMGASLIVALILDRLLFQRLGWFQG